MKAVAAILFLTLFNQSLAQTFHFDPYLSLSGKEGKIKLTRASLLNLLENQSYKKVFDETLMVDGLEFATSVSNKYISYDDYISFIAIKDLNAITEKGMLLEPLASNCDHTTEEIKRDAYRNLRVRSTFRGRLLSNQFDLALEGLKKDDYKIGPHLVIAAEMLSPGSLLTAEQKLTEEERKEIIQGIEDKQFIEKVITGEKNSESDYERVIALIDKINLDSKILKEGFSEVEVEHIYSFNRMSNIDKAALLKSLQGETGNAAVVAGFVVATLVAVATAKIMASVHQGEFCMPRDITRVRDIRPPPRTVRDGAIPSPSLPRGTR